ncbi:glycerophosphodiester phosphodiesterase [Ranunculus cassubicifolius]
MAALKAMHVSDVLHHDHPSTPCSTSQLCSSLKTPGFAVIGHRGNGMNKPSSDDPRINAIKENSLLSFNAAASLGVDFVEFDVQVTKDGIPIIFHDDFILTTDGDRVSKRRVTDMSLEEFLSYGPQTQPGHMGKPLCREAKDGKIYSWIVEEEDAVCTLREAFDNVDSSVGFNIELKFDDHHEYTEQELVPVLHVILLVVFKHAKGRPIVFSTFQPDAAGLIRKLQNIYPVFFLTDGGVGTLYKDVRRNSLDEAMTLCLDNGLQGIVSEVRAIFRYPEIASKIKDSKLSLFTYGQLNNVPEVVRMQYLTGINGVIVDFVEDIVEAVSDFSKASDDDEFEPFFIPI